MGKLLVGYMLMKVFNSCLLTRNQQIVYHHWQQEASFRIMWKKRILNKWKKIVFKIRNLLLLAIFWCKSFCFYCCILFCFCLFSILNLINKKLRTLVIWYDPGNYSCLKVDLIFTRDRAFYFTTVFIPGIILVTSSFITFWLEWNAVPARSMIGKLKKNTTNQLFLNENQYNMTHKFTETYFLLLEISKRYSQKLNQI